MKHEACVFLPTAATKSQLPFAPGVDDKFLANLSWNGSTTNAESSSCRSTGSMSSSATNPTTGDSTAGGGVLTTTPPSSSTGQSPLLNGVASAASSPQADGATPGGNVDVVVGRAPSSTDGFVVMGAGSASGGEVVDASGATTMAFHAITSPTATPMSQQQQHAVFVHVNMGQTLSVRVGNDIQHIPGPATVRMVSSHNSPPPMALPLHVPPGHIVQQIIDETGVLRHLILSPQTPPIVASAAAPYPSNVPNGVIAPSVQFLPVQNGHHHHHQHEDLASPVPPACQTSPSSFYPPLPLVTDPHHVCPLHISHEDPSMFGGISKGTRPNRYEKRRRDIYPGMADFRNLHEDAEGVDVSLLIDDNTSAATSGTEEEEVAKIAEMLSRVPPPQVSEIGPREALVTWQPFDCSEASASGGPFPQIDASEFTYQVLLYERRPDGEPRDNFRCHADAAPQQWLADLKPSTEYYVRLRALLEERGLNGEPSTVVGFKTKPSQPDKPLPPRLGQRLKTSLLLRWTQPCENGSKILCYHLELDDANTSARGDFKEVYAGANKLAKVGHLQPSTLYKVRLAASNQHGKSEYSDVLLVQTSGAAPLCPEAPRLLQATPNSLTLEWLRREGDEEFRLEMEDVTTGHGFLPVGVTYDCSYTVHNLLKHKEFRFRLSAANEDGGSQPSEIVVYRTLPGKPAPPTKLGVKGKVGASALRLAWDPPRDTGGGDIIGYRLECDCGIDGSSQTFSGGWKEIYNGCEREFTASNLQPGVTYKFRVACTSLGGQSSFSDMLNASTACTPPGPCHEPLLNGKARQTSVHLKWTPPDSTGGSELTEFDICVESSEAPFIPQAPCIVYKGPKMDCVVSGLSPGQIYLFRARAHNRSGVGPWSLPFECQTGAAPPEPPLNLCCASTSFNCISLRWQPPLRCNGPPVAEYRLQQAARKTVVSQVPDLIQSNVTGSPSSIIHDDAVDDGATVAHKNSPLVDRRRLGVVAGRANSSSSASTTSSLSSASVCSLPNASSPSLQPGHGHFSESTTFHGHGSESTNFHGSGSLGGSGSTSGPCVSTSLEQDFGPFVQIYSGSQTNFEARGLTPASDYAFRVQAVSIAGLSKFSVISVVRTPPGPPDAPLNVCAETLSSNKISIYWDSPNENGSPLIGFSLDVQPTLTNLPVPIQLPAHCAQHIVDGLMPETIYRFRVQASNDIGAGPQSAAIKAATYGLPPLPPQLELLSATVNSLKLKWSEPRSSGVSPQNVCSSAGGTPQTPASSTTGSSDLSFSTPSSYTYAIEIENKSGGFSRVYEGPGRTCKAQRLSEHTSYRFRLRAATPTSGVGAWSDFYSFKTTLAPPPAVKDQIKVVESKNGSSYHIEWQPIKHQLNAGEKIVYLLHLCSSNRATSANLALSSNPDEFKLIYRGIATHFCVENLPGLHHRIKVAAVRVTPNICEDAGVEPSATVTETCGPWSSVVTLASSHAALASQHKSATDFSDSHQTCANQCVQETSTIWTDRQWAALIVVGFSVITIFIAILLQRLVS